MKKDSVCKIVDKERKYLFFFHVKHPERDKLFIFKFKFEFHIHALWPTTSVLKGEKMIYGFK